VNETIAAAEPGNDVPAAEPPLPVHPGFRLLAFLGAIVVGGLGTGLGYRALGLPRPFVDGVAQPVGTLAIGCLVVLVGIVATWLPLRLLDRRGLDTVGLGFAWRAVPRIALGFLGGGLTPAIVLLVFAATGIATITPESPDLLRATLPMAAGFFLISCWEELALRGYFLQMIGEMSRPWIAAVASGLIFGLIHAGNPGANPAGLIITALNGVLLAFLVIRTGSLWLACGYHAGWNVIAAVAFGMRDSGMISRGALAVTDLAGPIWLTGGDYGFEASWVTGGVEAFVLTLLLIVAPRLASEPAAREFYRGRQRVLSV